MTDGIEYETFKARKPSKTYVSKVFSYSIANPEKLRNLWIVLDGSDAVQTGEIEGQLSLRVTGNARRTQVVALVSQDAKAVRRVTLQTFLSKGGEFYPVEKNEFTFRSDEFERLVAFLDQLKFIDLSNEANFQIEDISTQVGPKAIIDASDRAILDLLKGLSGEQRKGLLQTFRGELSPDEINILLGRKQGLAEFETHVETGDWTELQWQDFFEREQWVFGYGLDYRFMRPFGREMTVGGTGTDNQNKPTADFLMTFKDYTVIVEIKRPDTPIFKARKGGRAGTWDFSPDFMSAVSQILEQKAEWLSFAQSQQHYNKAGTEHLEARTRNAKSILVIGSMSEFPEPQNLREADMRRDTFELFRRENRTIDILTYDELLERARFITRDSR